MSSARFTVEANALGSLFDDPPLDFATLEEIAAQENIAPVSARRARALLGDDVARAALDALDARVVTVRGARRCERRSDPRSSRTRRTRLGTRRAPSHDVAPEWPTRVARASCRSRDGPRRVLARAGGKASFEDLARHVWQRHAPTIHFKTAIACALRFTDFLARWSKTIRKNRRASCSAARRTSSVPSRSRLLLRNDYRNGNAPSAAATMMLVMITPSTIAPAMSVGSHSLPRRRSISAILFFAMM